MQLLGRPETRADGYETDGPTSGRSARVLIVDDEPNVRLVFRTALEAAGYVLSEATDGAEALEVIGGRAPDVVLLDLQMPGTGGMDTLRRLRESGNGVPVVIVTAYGSIPDAVAAMKLGAIDFLTKPLTPEVLRRVVSEVVARHGSVAGEPEASPQLSAPPTTVTIGPPAVDLTPAKRALNRREFELAAQLLEAALDADPASPEAHNLMGVLSESRGEDHAAYHSYKAALTSDNHYSPARDNMRPYCDRCGLDSANPAVNPAAGA